MRNPSHKRNSTLEDFGDCIRCSALQEECLFHSSIPQAEHLAMEIDRGIAVVGPNLQLVAYLRGKIRVQDVDDGMLGVQLAKTCALRIL